MQQPQDHRQPGRFTYRTKGGVRVDLPALGSVPAGTIRRHRHKPEADFLFSVIEDVLDTDELATLDGIPLRDLNALFAAWQDDEGASLGESSGSST